MGKYAVAYDDAPCNAWLGSRFRFLQASPFGLMVSLARGILRDYIDGLGWRVKLAQPDAHAAALLS
jgi:hypothetical protein